MEKRQFIAVFLLFFIVPGCNLQDCVKICEYDITSQQLISKFTEITSGLETFSATSSALGISYNYKNVEDLVIHAKELIRQSDVFAEMLSLTETTSCADNFTGHLDFAIREFKVLLDNVTLDGHRVHDIISVFQLAEVQTQMGKHVKQISSINQQFLVFMQNISLNNVLKIVNYYDNIEPILKIGELLTNNTETPFDSPLFGQIIKQRGYCNGTEIVHVFNYLLAVYIEGCVSFSISEAIKFNTAITRQRDRCMSTLDSAKIMRVNLFEECRKEDCTHIENNLEHFSVNNDIRIFEKVLKDMYPWFHFLILRFIRQSQPSENLIGNALSSLTIKENDEDGLQIILWTTRNSTNASKDTRMYKYGIEYKNTTLESISNNINMISESGSSNRTRLVGYVEYPERYKCRKIFNRNDSGKDCSQLSCTIAFPGYGFILIAAAVIIIAGIIAVIYIVRKKRSKRSVYTLYFSINYNIFLKSF